MLRTMRAAYPSFLGLDGHLWTRRAVADLIRIQTGHLPTTGAVDQYLRRWQLTAPAPTQTEPRLPRLSCHWITVADCPAGDRMSQAEEIWPALVVETRRGGVHLRLPRGCVDLGTVHVFGRHLVQHTGRPVQLLVWRWPDNLRDILEAWQADPGPGLLLAGEQARTDASS